MYIFLILLILGNLGVTLCCHCYPSCEGPCEKISVPFL